MAQARPGRGTDDEDQDRQRNSPAGAASPQAEQAGGKHQAEGEDQGEAGRDR